MTTEKTSTMAGWPNSSGKGGLIERSLSTLNQDHPVSKFGSPNKKDIQVTTPRQAAKEANVRLLTNSTERLRHAKDKSRVSRTLYNAESLPKKVNITDQGSLPRSESSPTSRGAPSNKPKEANKSGNARRSSMHLGSSPSSSNNRTNRRAKKAKFESRYQASHTSTTKDVEPDLDYGDYSLTSLLVMAKAFGALFSVLVFLINCRDPLVVAFTSAKTSTTKQLLKYIKLIKSVPQRDPYTKYPKLYAALRWGVIVYIALPSVVWVFWHLYYEKVHVVFTCIALVVILW